MISSLLQISSLFRLFADDTNVFASSKNLKELESTMNQELQKVKKLV